MLNNRSSLCFIAYCSLFAPLSNACHAIGVHFGQEILNSHYINGNEVYRTCFSLDIYRTCQNVKIIILIFSCIFNSLMQLYSVHELK